MRRAAVLAGAIAVDLALGELPDRWHPVAWFGRGFGWLDRRLAPIAEKRPLLAGSLLAGTGVAAGLGGALLTGRLARGHPGIRYVLIVVALKQTFAVRALFEHAGAVERALARRQVEEAREAVGGVVSRETGELGETGIASAAIESLAENASDSAIAPWTWYLIAGLPGAMAYRAINTMDAMIGYHSRGPVGAPAARLDDLANIVPARLTAGLLGLAAGAPGAVTRAREDARSTSSPNSGWPMATAAYALNRRLEKPGHHVLNDAGRGADAVAVSAAMGLVARALALGAAAALLVAWRRRR